ncbi:MAG: hypothetical protein AB1646_05015 [Thermodesulfobacteriota bacterium]
MGKKKINAKDLVKDIRAGLDDDDLMLQYDLTPQELERVFGKLVEADFITVVELHERAKLSDTQVTKAFVEAQRAIDELD